MKYRAKDIAKELKVSPATVSLVLNRKPGVGNTLRQKILKKIEDMECEHLIKEDLSGKGNIGLIIYKCNGAIIDEFPFFGLLLENINRTIRKYNYQMNMIYMDKVMTIEEQVHIMENTGCQGYIVYAVEMYAEDLKVFQTLNEPCVFLDNSFRMNEVDAVTIDNSLGVYQAIKYLYQKGHRSIGYIKSKVMISSFDERFEAFQKSLDMYGLKLKEEHVMKVGYLESETEQDVNNYLKRTKNLPTAYFADNDLLACRAVHGMKEMGYKIPEDISVVGFDNRPICSFTEPTVTTIGIPRDDMGYTAVEMLMSKIKGHRQLGLKSLVGTSLIERESVSERKEER